MGEYLYSARGLGGATVKSRATAVSAAAARADLEAQGYADVVIHTDDFGAEVEDALLVDVPAGLDPAALIDAHSEGGMGSLLWRVVKANALVFAVLLGWNLYSLVFAGALGWSDWLGLGLTGVLGVVVVWVMVPTALFEAVLWDQLWGRWHNAQRWVGLLRRFRSGPRLAAHALDYYAAKNLIGLGKIDEGLALFERHLADGRAPRALLLGLKASLLDEAKRRGEAGELLQQLTQLMPDSAQVWLDWALNQALYGEVDQAKAALGEAQQRELNPIMSAVVPFVQSLIDAREARHGAALQGCLQTLTALAPFARQPAIAPLLLLVQFRYAFALARCGKHEAARRAWAVAQAVLEARGEREIIGEWERIGGARA